MNSTLFNHPTGKERHYVVRATHHITKKRYCIGFVMSYQQAQQYTPSKDERADFFNFLLAVFRPGKVGFDPTIVDEKVPEYMKYKGMKAFNDKPGLQNREVRSPTDRQNARPTINPVEQAVNNLTPEEFQQWKKAMLSGQCNSTCANCGRIVLAHNRETLHCEFDPEACALLQPPVDILSIFRESLSNIGLCSPNP